MSRSNLRCRWTRGARPAGVHIKVFGFRQSKRKHSSLVHRYPIVSFPPEIHCWTTRNTWEYRPRPRSIKNNVRLSLTCLDDMCSIFSKRVSLERINTAPCRICPSLNQQSLRFSSPDCQRCPWSTIISINDHPQSMPLRAYRNRLSVSTQADLLDDSMRWRLYRGLY